MELFKIVKRCFNFKRTTTLLAFCLFLFLIYYYNYNIYVTKNMGYTSYKLQVMTTTEVKIKGPKRVLKKFPSCTECRVSNKYRSTCGHLADNLGPGQRVISYSFYKGKVKEFDNYLRGIEANVLALRQVYNSKNWSSSWVIRIYSDLEMPLNLVKKYPNELFWCDIREILPGGYLKMFKMSWRFLPLGDPTVDIFLSRDLDGILTEREYFAVDEWLKLSNHSFHSMRDHKNHTFNLMGGMWGANNNILGLETAQIIRQKFLEAGPMNDQVALSKFIWTDFSHVILAHDSFHCQEVDKYGNNSRPWPTQREPSGDFIGNRVFRSSKSKIRVECPIQCRPSDHKDWIYC